MQLTESIRHTVETLPEALRPDVSRWFERLCEEHAPSSISSLAELAHIVAISNFAAELLLRYWSDLEPQLASMPGAFDSAGLEAFADRIAGLDTDTDTVKRLLRRERNERLLGILWRDALGHASTAETLDALSQLADQLLRAAAAHAQKMMLPRFGSVRDEAREIVPMLILGMGKLGGHELNFSSDIDIIFAYPADGVSDGAKSLHAQPYFDRLSRAVVGLMDEVTADGFVFRTDTRLRPFGDSGPPVVSFAALESYLLQHGRDWERYAYVKASIVGPRPPAPVASELFETMITPFVYRRYLDYGVFESLREMHGLIASEGRRRELRNNIKLGPGGIREIEFVVQSLQLVRGGDRPELQTPSLLKVLPLLVDGRGLDADVAQALRNDYLFLRRLENFIQAMYDKQTHDLPDNPVDQARLALAMDFDDWPALVDATAKVRSRVSAHFDDIAFRDRSEAVDEPLLPVVTRLWTNKASEEEWTAALAAARLRDAAAIASSIVSFQNAPATRQISTQAAERLRYFIPQLVLLAGASEKPGLAVTRSLTVISSTLRRSAYLALLNENRVAAERLVSLCAQSEYISTELARFPVLLDELLDPSLATGPLSREQLQTELDERLAQYPAADSEEKMELLAQFQRATMFRVAVSDFSGKLQIMQVSDSLTFLAETILDKALEIALQELVDKHGKPHFAENGELHEAGFGVIAYGKLGGIELSYGSDLDVVFLHDSRGSNEMTNGARPLDNSMFFSRLVRRLVHFLTTRTNTGALYEIDTRLRPSGRKGLLVSSLEAFTRYQDENAWTWEHQALLRARPIAGSAKLAAEFERIRAETLMQRVRRDSLRDDVLQMRKRMRKELDSSDSKQFNLKHGKGGIGDIEFLVQYLVLRVAVECPPVIEFTDNIRQLNALAECGELSLARAADLQQAYRHYRLRQHHLALNDEPPLVPDTEFRAERALVDEAWQDAFGS